MFKNYLKISLRNLIKHKGFSFINIFGLAVGLAITIILFFYVLDDLSYDKYHENSDNIYRLLSINDRGIGSAVTSGPLLPAAKENIPEVISATRMTMGNQAQVARAGATQETSINTKITYADPDFFKVFSFKILHGENADALDIPGSVFLTPGIAVALFGDEDPIGQPLQVSGVNNARVAGIVESPLRNSHIQFDIITSLIPEERPIWWNSWENQALYGYILLSGNADFKSVENKIIETARNNNFSELFTPRLQHLLDIHLGSSDIRFDFSFHKNDRVLVYTLGALGILVLLVACINFINLSTSRASSRACEIAIRKVTGSSRKQIAFQFLSESVFMTVFAFFIAVFIIQLITPFLDSILNKQLNLNIIDNLGPLLIFLGFAVITGILSGIFPSIVLSSFEPVDVLRKESKTGKKGIFVRRILVIFQFAITTSLIVAVLIIWNQINFLKFKNMGYDRKNVMSLSAPMQNDSDILRQKFSEFPGVISASRISNLPETDFFRTDVSPEGTDRTDGYQAVRLFTDYEFFDNLNIPVVQGRNFSEEFTTDSLNNVIVNEELVRIARWGDPIGKRVVLFSDFLNKFTYNVIGVAKDFHYKSPKQAIEPMMFHFMPQRGTFFLIRLHPEGIQETISLIKEVYSEVYPERSFNYTFLDDMFNNQFSVDREFARNVGIFAGIAIIIACLGLTGLVAYTIEKRKKEIAVRKILGCSGKTITFLLVYDFLKWIVFANIIAWPCTHFTMGVWLNEFAYKESFTILPYITGGIGAFFIALFTILFQTIKAASANPVDSLRSQ
jgi:putative ABC transport system permease protein